QDNPTEGGGARCCGKRQLEMVRVVKYNACATDSLTTSDMTNDNAKSNWGPADSETSNFRPNSCSWSTGKRIQNYEFETPKLRWLRCKPGAILVPAMLR